MNLATATPVEIDTILAGLYRDAAAAERGVKAAIAAIHRAAGERQSVERHGRATRRVWPTTDEQATTAARGRDAGEWVISYSTTWGEIVAKLDAAKAAEDAIDAEVATYAAEYARRPWSRFFTVAGGHIHSSMSCSTCNRGEYATSFGWNPELSGLAEADAVAAKGPALCTVCFPSAPVEWTVGAPKKSAAEKAADAAAAAAEARRTDPKLIAAVDGGELRVDGGTLRTVRSAEIAAVDALTWAAYSRHGVGHVNEANARRHEGHAAEIVAALAAKNGTTAAAELARITEKAIKKVRRDLGADVATAAAAVWAGQAAAGEATDEAPRAEGEIRKGDTVTGVDFIVGGRTEGVVMVAGEVHSSDPTAGRRYTVKTAGGYVRAIHRAELVTPEAPAPVEARPVEARVLASANATAERMLDAIGAAIAAGDARVPATVDEHTRGNLADAGFTGPGDRVTNRGLEHFTAKRGDAAARELARQAPADVEGQGDELEAALVAAGIPTRTWRDAWAAYRRNHPEVLASWGEQNGRWPNCPCEPCDPRGERPRPDVIAYVVEVNEGTIDATRQGVEWWNFYRARFAGTGRIVDTVPACVVGGRVEVACDSRDHAERLADYMIDAGIPRSAVRVKTAARV